MRGRNQKDDNDMTDRELLEAAAKAAGLLFKWTPVVQNYTAGKTYIGPIYWNPLDDDCHAFRLAVKLRFSVMSNETASWIAHGIGQMNIAEEYHDGNDPYAATRRAIVRAAAQIGATT